jgi:hypothetical protein
VSAELVSLQVAFAAKTCVAFQDWPATKTCGVFRDITPANYPIFNANNQAR